MNNKFILTDETKIYYGYTLHRIKALKDFGNVKAGDLGGWVEKEENLSRIGDCWIYDEAKVCGEAFVVDYACVCGGAMVYDNAWVSGRARVYDNAWVHGNAKVSHNARVYGCADVYGNADVRYNAKLKKTDDILYITGIGSRHGTTTVYRDKDGGLTVSCGCFLGTLEEFAAKVKETHGDNRFGREYKAFIEMAKVHFGKEE